MERSDSRPFCDKTPLHNDQGMVLLMVLLAVVIIGLAAGIAGSTWRDMMARVKEQELLFRGDQYRRAIESYYNVKHGGAPNVFPSKLEDLLKDPRFPGMTRHLRKLWPDPVTGNPFIPIKDPTKGGRITGVKSGSQNEPFKKSGFSLEYEDFKDKTSYQEWQFVYEPPKKANQKTEQPKKVMQQNQQNQP